MYGCVHSQVLDSLLVAVSRSGEVESVLHPNSSQLELMAERGSIKHSW